jgi:serine/threonine protein kinase
MPVSDDLIAAAMGALNVVAVRELRSGGQKTVRLVRRAEQELVLKVISLGSSTPDALRRAQREVELLGRVSDPHLVQAASELVELGDPVTGAAWLEVYLEGEDLGDLLGNPWSWEDVVAMACDVGSGLAALHAAKVVHRDLSANNVRSLSRGGYVVMDPGFARHAVRSDMTVGGQPGTAGFLSPEHLHAFSGAPTPASDIFCLGNLMFYALTGRLAIEIGSDIADYLVRLSRVEIGNLALLRPDLTAEQLAFVLRCLHPQPARRPRNGARFLQTLQASL